MDEVIKLVFPFFNVPKSYSDVLKKLASLTFYEVYFITFLLRSNKSIDGFFSGLESWGPIGKALAQIPHSEVFNVSGLVIAFLVAMLTFIFQLHDRVSDLLQIRKNFDVRCILVPLSERVGIPVTKDKEAKVIARRHELMLATFYKYASSRAATPLVDKHDIEQALNAWSWLWVAVEGVVYFTVAILIALRSGAFDLGFIFFLISLSLLVVALLQYRRLPDYARPQVETIASDAGAAASVHHIFDAL